MKKKIIVSMFIAAVCLSIVGCKKEEKEVSSKDWVVDYNAPNTIFGDDILGIFNDAANNYTSMKLSPIAILGEQVVAGKNYMFLAKADNTYKVVVIYRDLEGKSTITKVSDFDVLKYVNENIQLKAEDLVGGWKAYIPGKPIMLEDKMQTIFDKATEKVVGITYLPITPLAHQDKSGTNYAVLSYGRMSDANATTGLYVLTIYVDEHNTIETVAIANVNLSDYN